MFLGISPSPVRQVRTGGGHIFASLHGVFRVLSCDDDGNGIYRVLKRDAMLLHRGVSLYVGFAMVIGLIDMFGCT